MSVEERLRELGIELPEPAAPAGSYVPARLHGDLLAISGQIPVTPGEPLPTGRCGVDVTVEEGYALARQCALNGLAAARAALGSLDRVAGVVRVGGYVAAAPDFTQHPAVVNGASDLLVEVFGESGRHVRAAVGMASLPLGVPVEVEFLFAIAPGEGG
ncbi:MAG: RidA family protein [Dehalococcoidia bacterium]|nr:RidA family protein [Dehalococcoidia bacterium]MYD27371.1 RidA family protein [Dehalococcoidia bacterium]